MRSVLRAVLCVSAILAALPSLTACAVRDPTVGTSNITTAGNWQIEKQIDRITGAPLESALLTAPSSHSGEAFSKRATLQLACFNKKPLVRFEFEVKVATTRSNEFGYRFDDRPGHQITAGFLGNARVAVIEDSAAIAQFLGELATGQKLYLRIRSLSFGRTTAEFNVEGATAAMAATTARCPPVIEEPKTNRKPRR